MDITKLRNQHLHQTKKKLISSLVINLLVPWILYILLHDILRSDTTSLAITASLSAVKSLILWIWRRKTDLIGILGVFGFSAAFIVTIITGGSSLPLKLVHPIIFGSIGLAFIISVLLGKPLMITILRILMPNNQERFNSPLGHKKFTIMTTLFGGISLIGSGIHIILALTLSTSAFLAVSHVVTWLTILALGTSGRLIVPRIK